MILSDVTVGDPHVDAHNAERALINAIQAIIDPDFSQALLDFVAAQVANGSYVPVGDWDFSGANVTGLDIPAAFADLTDVDWTTPPTDGQTFVWDAVNSKLVPVDFSTSKAFSELTDVDWTTPPTDGQTFTWDVATNKLIPVDFPADTTGVLLLENGQTAADVPADTPVGTVVFEKGA